MKRILLMGSVLMAILLLPALASATHITDMVAIADCDGFNASVDVHFRSTAEYLDLSWDVVVLDTDGNQVDSVSGTMHVVQEDEQDITIMVSDVFTAVLDGNFTVVGTLTVNSPYPGGVDENSQTFENEIECGSVATDEVNFESLKALFR